VLLSKKRPRLLLVSGRSQIWWSGGDFTCQRARSVPQVAGADPGEWQRSCCTLSRKKQGYCVLPLQRIRESAMPGYRRMCLCERSARRSVHRPTIEIRTHSQMPETSIALVYPLGPPLSALRLGCALLVWLLVKCSSTGLGSKRGKGATHSTCSRPHPVCLSCCQCSSRYQER
jgi:hypothetical protein